MTESQDIPQDELMELQGLLRLKNHERPVDGYFEDFLDEFHRRQRLEKQSQATKPSLGEKFSTWFQGLGAARWAIGAAGAYAALFIGFLALPDANPTQGTHGIATGSEEILPGDRRLEHVELEKDVQNPDEVREILPSEF